MSRDPSDSYKIQAQSIPELKDGFDALSKRIAREIQFRGRKLRTGPLLNAVVVHYLRLSEEEQMRIAREGLAVYESLLDLDRPEDDAKAVRPREGDVLSIDELPPGTRLIGPGGEAASRGGKKPPLVVEGTDEVVQPQRFERGQPGDRVGARRTLGKKK